MPDATAPTPAATNPTPAPAPAKAEPAKATAPKAADPAPGVSAREAVATLQHFEGADPTEAAIVDGLVKRALCGHEGSRIVDLQAWGKTLVDDVKAVLSYYRGE